VNAICPGYVDTKRWQDGEAERKRVLDRIPMRRLGRPKKWPRPSGFWLARKRATSQMRAQIDGGIF